MPKKNKKNNVHKKIQRDIAKEEGFYDGRFKPKVVPDKKKENDKKKCRKKINTEE